MGYSGTQIPSISSHKLRHEQLQDRFTNKGADLAQYRVTDSCQLVDIFENILVCGRINRRWRRLVERDKPMSILEEAINVPVCVNCPEGVNRG